MTDLRIGLLGWGALGSEIGTAVERGDVAGARLAAVAAPEVEPGSLSVPVVAPDALADHCDIIVEAAVQQAVVDHVPGYLEAGCTVVVLSTGAFRDSDLFSRLVNHGSRRLVLCSGAIGAIDLIAACRSMGPINRIELETSKPPKVLVQPWMDAAMVTALEAGNERVECFHGPAAIAAERFPTSVNVAATLSLAAGSWDTVEVSVVGDPDATGNRHRITIDAEAGRYEIDVSNAALASNPRSSAIVVGAALRALTTLASDQPRFL